MEKLSDPPVPPKFTASLKARFVAVVIEEVDVKAQN